MTRVTSRSEDFIETDDGDVRHPDDFVDRDEIPDLPQRPPRAEAVAGQAIEQATATWNTKPIGQELLATAEQEPEDPYFAAYDALEGAYPSPEKIKEALARRGIFHPDERPPKVLTPLEMKLAKADEILDPEEREHARNHILALDRAHSERTSGPAAPPRPKGHHSS